MKSTKSITKNYYAQLWHLGYGTVSASDGSDKVRVIQFEDKKERDNYVADYVSPTFHCPTARAEAVKASHKNVRSALKYQDIYELNGGELDLKFLPQI